MIWDRLGNWVPIRYSCTNWKIESVWFQHFPVDDDSLKSRIFVDRQNVNIICLKGSVKPDEWHIIEDEESFSCTCSFHLSNPIVSFIGSAWDENIPWRFKLNDYRTRVVVEGKKRDTFQPGGSLLVQSSGVVEAIFVQIPVWAHRSSICCVTRVCFIVYAHVWMVHMVNSR